MHSVIHILNTLKYPLDYFLGGITSKHIESNLLVIFYECLNSQPNENKRALKNKTRQSSLWHKIKNQLYLFIIQI